MAASLVKLLETCIESDPNRRPDDAAVLASKLKPLLKRGRRKGKEAVGNIGLPTPPPPRLNDISVEAERNAREIEKAARHALEETERQQQVEEQEQHLAGLHDAGLAKLSDLIRAILDRTQGEITDEDYAVLNAHCREYKISKDEGRTVFAEVRKQREAELPVAETVQTPGEVVTNSLGMKLAWVPAGAFWMGERGSQTKVAVPQGFYMGVYPVTQGKWQTVMGNNPSCFSREGDGADRVKDISDADLLQFPVEQVNCADIDEFLQKLNERERNNRFLYRLPTEAEWEYACRGGATSEEECSFDFYLDRPTNDLSSAQANFDGNYPAGNALQGKLLWRTSKVGSYIPNRLGICDMHGNVWEWCTDLYESGDSARVVRGGSWIFKGSDCRASDRDWIAPSDRNDSLGFRLVAVPSGEQVNPKRVHHDVSLSDLSKAGLLHVGDKLYMKSKGNIFEGTIKANFEIDLSGKSFSNPTAAAAHAMDASESSRQTEDGWDKWTTKDGDSLDDLRSKYLQNVKLPEKNMHRRLLDIILMMGRV